MNGVGQRNDTLACILRSVDGKRRLQPVLSLIHLIPTRCRLPSRKPGVYRRTPSVPRVLHLRPRAGPQHGKSRSVPEHRSTLVAVGERTRPPARALPGSLDRSRTIDRKRSARTRHSEHSNPGAQCAVLALPRSGAPARYAGTATVVRESSEHSKSGSHYHSAEGSGQRYPGHVRIAGRSFERHASSQLRPPRMVMPKVNGSVLLKFKCMRSGWHDGWHRPASLAMHSRRIGPASAWLAPNGADWQPDPPTDQLTLMPLM